MSGREFTPRIGTSLEHVWNLFEFYVLWYDAASLFAVGSFTVDLQWISAMEMMKLVNEKTEAPRNEAPVLPRSGTASDRTLDPHIRKGRSYN